MEVLSPGVGVLQTLTSTDDGALLCAIEYDARTTFQSGRGMSGLVEVVTARYCAYS